MTELVGVQLAGPQHAELVHRLTREAFVEYLNNLEPPTGALGETVADAERAIAADGAAIAWIGELPVGSVRLDVEPDHLYAGRLAVPPAHRSKGVGPALMAFAEQRAIMLGLPAVRVEVRSALPRNIAFFERLGFVHRETRPHPRLPSAIAVILEKSVMMTEVVHS